MKNKHAKKVRLRHTQLDPKVKAPKLDCPRCQQALVPAESDNPRCRNYHCSFCAEDFNTNFMCGLCGMRLVEAGRTPEGRIRYNCSACGKNELLGCTVCGFPRAIWADDGKVCGSCAISFMFGEQKLTERDEARCMEWRVMVDL